MGEIDLSASLVKVNQLNNQLQRVSADARNQQKVRDLASQILLECEIIREVTDSALKDSPPGLFEKWFGKRFKK